MYYQTQIIHFDTKVAVNVSRRGHMGRLSHHWGGTVFWEVRLMSAWFMMQASGCMSPHRTLL